MLFASKLLQLHAEGNTAVRREFVKMNDIRALLMVNGHNRAIAKYAVRHARAFPAAAP